jgi:hypothetical protein
MFARRPKVTPSDTILAGKVNSELFRFASFACQLGIPTIAGFPAVKSVMELHSDPRVFWLHIEGLRASEFFVDLSSNREQALIDTDGNPVPTMSLDDIAEYVSVRARTLAWNHAMHTPTTDRGRRSLCIAVVSWLQACIFVDSPGQFGISRPMS